MNSKFHKTIEEYKNKIRYFNYSKRTEQIYIHYFEKFLEYIDKYPQHLTFSAGELLSLYFYGINIQVRDGSEFDKTVVEFYIKQAQKHWIIKYNKSNYLSKTMDKHSYR